MSDSITVRSATSDDAPFIVRASLRLAAETEDKSLDLEVLTAGVAAALADAHKARYFMATSGERVVGQLMITREWSDWRNGHIWWIQSVYVEPEFRRCGVYRALHQHVEQLARQAPKIVGLRLYVEKNNHPAQSVYKALGMKEAGYEVYEQMF